MLVLLSLYKDWILNSGLKYCFATRLPPFCHSFQNTPWLWKSYRLRSRLCYRCLSTDVRLYCWPAWLLKELQLRVSRLSNLHFLHFSALQSVYPSSYLGMWKGLGNIITMIREFYFTLCQLKPKLPMCGDWNNAWVSIHRESQHLCFGCWVNYIALFFLHKTSLLLISNWVKIRIE